MKKLMLIGAMLIMGGCTTQSSWRLTAVNNLSIARECDALCQRVRATFNTVFPNNCWKNNNCQQVMNSGDASAAMAQVGRSMQAQPIDFGTTPAITGTTTITHIGSSTYIQNGLNTTTCNTIGTTVFCN